MKFGKKIMVVILALAVIMTTVINVQPVSAKKVFKPVFTLENVKKGVKLTWNTYGASKTYKIMRKDPKKKSFKLVKKVEGKAGYYVDKTAKQGKSYKYKVIGEKASNVQTIKTIAAPVIEDISGYEGVSIKWDEVDGAKEYEIYRADITTSEAGVYEMDFNYMQNYTLGEDDYKYFTWEKQNVFAAFKVRAVNGKNKGPFSNIIIVSHIAPPDFSAWYNEDKSAVNIYFDTIENANGYRIYRKEQGGEYQMLVDIPKSELEKYKPAEGSEKLGFEEFCYVDSTIPKDDKTYYYSVDAYADRFSVKASQPIW